MLRFAAKVLFCLPFYGIDRTHRIGQTRKVMVYRLVAKDTIEEKVMSLKARKAALFANVIDGGEFESGAMTAEDVRELLG